MNSKKDGVYREIEPMAPLQLIAKSRTNEIELERLWGMDVVFVQKSKSVTLDIVGKNKGFSGENKAEVVRKLFDWVNRKPVKRLIKPEKRPVQFDADSLRYALKDMKLPSRLIRVSPDYVYRSKCKRESYFVRRQIGRTGKIYFGTYHTRKEAVQASLLLCSIINEEIKCRQIKQSLSAKNVVHQL